MPLAQSSGEVAGWERPNWFALDGQERTYNYSYGKQNWFEASGVECDSRCETPSASSTRHVFVKFRVEGPDALTALNEICANEVDVAAGKAVYTQWCNDRGGIEADLTVTRISESRVLRRHRRRVRNPRRGVASPRDVAVTT